MADGLLPNPLNSVAGSSLEREALMAMRAMRRRIEELEEARREQIAVIGLACKLPGGVEDADSYWNLLRDKTNAVREIPSDRFAMADIYDADADAPGKTNSRWAGLLDRVDEFDAAFFGISPREAAHMDPQQRIFLECIWRALEDAAIAPGAIAGSATGVFVGATTHEYATLHAGSVAAEEIDRYSGVGLALNAIAGRVSYVLGLHGPSMCIDAACASSLVAVDRACRSLRDGECEMALAGGVNVVALRESLITAARSGMLSSAGRVDAFGLGADGFVRGEGCGVVVLKRLSSARRDEDRVLAVIAGSAVNHDGPGSGLTVPNGQAQAALLRSALKSAGIAPAAVGYVEAHGTGTRLGDPIEAEALGAVFGAGGGSGGRDLGERDRALMIGSVKTNLGHLEAAAGIAGLIKVVLALEHRELPAQLHGDPPSEHVRWSDLPLEVVRQQRQWEPIAGRRIAGVSAFGFSGTNAHVIVEEAPAEEFSEAPQPVGSVEVLALSAKSAASLAMLAERYASHLAAHPEQDWGDVCYTAAVGRTHFKHRLAVVASSGAEARTLLREGSATGSGAVLHVGLGPRQTARDGAALSLAEAYVSGSEPDWAAWHAGTDGGRGRRRVRLPGYAFERERHWLSGSRGMQGKQDSGLGLRGDLTAHPLLGERLRLAGDGARYEWPARPVGELAWLGEHRIAGQAILPATAYLEMLLAAGERMAGTSSVRVEELTLIAPLHLVEEGSAWPVVQVAVDPAGPPDVSRVRVRIYSSNEKGSHASGSKEAGSHEAGGATTATFEWRLHGEGYVSRSPAAPQEKTFSWLESGLEAVRERCPDVIEAPVFYARMQAGGADFGPRFKRVRRVWRGKGEALGEVALETPGEALHPKAPKVSAAAYGNRLHPACLDACLQVAAALLPEALLAHVALSADTLLANPPTHEAAPTWLPAKLEKFQYHAVPVLLAQPQTHETVCLVHATLLPSSTTRSAELGFAFYLPKQARPFATLQKLTFKRQGNSKSETTSTSWVFGSEWISAVSLGKPTEDPFAGQWLVVTDSTGMGAQLGRAISAGRGSCFFIELGDQYQQIDDRRFMVKPDDREHYARVTTALRNVGSGADGKPLRIVHLGSLEAPGFEETTPGGLLGSQVPGYGSCLVLVQALLEQGLNATLCVVTRSAQMLKAEEGAAAVSPAGAALWALCRTMRAEHPEMDARCIDLAEVAESGDSDRLLELLLNETGPEMLLRASAAYAPRWTFRQAAVARDNKPSLELRAGTTGLIEDLTYAGVERRAPGHGEVEIEVRATGLNFRDVMNTLKMLGDGAQPLGGECAGVVLRAGANVSFRLGDEVVAFAAGAFRSYVTVGAQDAVLKPAGLSFAQAACLPIAYLTAMLGLDRMARIQPGETILIHAAAGGLGQAAVRVAKARGARIYATAGSHAKREYLRAQEVELAVDSRTLEFASQVLEATAGRGVDIVLNSLAGDFIEEGFRALTVGGCFLETGKRSVLSKAEAARRRPDVRYFCFDLGEEAARDTDLVPSLLKELMDQIESGLLTPLPVESVPFLEAAQVFRRLAQATHIGKLAVTHEGRWRLSRKPGTYLITGGLGALGLGAMEWLFRHGARSFLLLSRHKHPESEETLLKFRRAGAAIRIAYADCADQDALRAALGMIPPDAPLRGVLHCAGVVHDALIMDQDWQSFREVAAPKLAGAWNLHQATAGLELEFFVLFSSASAIVGSPGQANYAAANAAMDAVAHIRRANGLPALTINWGPWTEGMATQTRRESVPVGLGSLDPATGFEILEQLLQEGSVQATVLPLTGENSRETAQALAASGMSMGAFRKRTEGIHAESSSLLAQLGGLPAEQRRSLLIAHIEGALAAISGLGNPAFITAETEFFDLGFDSLMAVELRNYLIKSLGRNLPATIAIDYPTVGSIAEYISSLVSPAPLPKQHFETLPDSADPLIAALTESEAEALLLQELGGPV